MNNTKVMDMDLQERDKPKLTVDEQIAHLKDRGVTFNICSEDDAQRLLNEAPYWFKVDAYRKLYDTQIEGRHVGDYINLDFAYLVDLAEIDKMLRQTLLPLTLDVEQYAIANVARIIGKRDDEDGYSIVVDYWNGLPEKEREYRRSEIKRLTCDFYCESLIERYRNEMPAWAFMELLTFGVFIDFYLFCAERWHEKRMRQDHYALRIVKSARNAYAHSASVISNFRRQDRYFKTNANIVDALEKAGVSRQARSKRMKNVSIQQIVVLVYTYKRFVTGAEDLERARMALRRLQSRMDEHKSYYFTNNAISSTFGFLGKVFQIL